MKDIYIVIPTLDPDEEIMNSFILELQNEFEHILIINDGSKQNHDEFFASLEKKKIDVIKHYKNYGKGRGLKNAFNYLLLNNPKLKGVITCDCDGQHTVKDIKKCAKALLKNEDKLILGVRNFDKEGIPPKSIFGNKLTRNIFRIFFGLEISDTQTGLRGLSKKLMEEFIDLDGERYEYETNMLIECKKKSIGIEEVEIETIYLNGNENTHFNPIKDSIRIYKVFLKYFLMSLSSYIVDLLLFTWFLGIIRIDSKILAATILARIISSIYNYIVNYKLTFKDMDIKSSVKYTLLVISQMFISGCFTTYLCSLLNIKVIIIKVVVDLIIWIVNIFIKSDFIFLGDNYE